MDGQGVEPTARGTLLEHGRQSWRQETQAQGRIGWAAAARWSNTTDSHVEQGLEVEVGRLKPRWVRLREHRWWGRSAGQRREGRDQRRAASAAGGPGTAACEGKPSKGRTAAERSSVVADRRPRIERDRTRIPPSTVRTARSPTPLRLGCDPSPPGDRPTRFGASVFGHALRRIGLRTVGRHLAPGKRKGASERSEPHGRLQDATCLRRSSGENRRSREERQGRNEPGGGNSGSKREVVRARRPSGVDARASCRRRGDLGKPHERSPS